MTKPSSVAGRKAIPSIVHLLDPLVQGALRLGIPMEPNVLLTVRGRRTGELHTLPVAVLETEGRQFLFSPFGEVNWVHNLRASGTATIRHGRRRQTTTRSSLRPRKLRRSSKRGSDPSWARRCSGR